MIQDNPRKRPETARQRRRFGFLFCFCFCLLLMGGLFALSSKIGGPARIARAHITPMIAPACA